MLSKLCLKFFVLIAFSVSINASELIEDTYQKVRLGIAVSEDLKKQCSDWLTEEYERNSEKEGERTNYKWSEELRTDFYIKAIKVGIIDQDRNGGWAFNSTLRTRVYDGLKKRLAKEKDPFLKLVLVFPCLYKGKKDEAVQFYEELKVEDPFLAHRVLWSTADAYRDRQWLVNYYLKKGKKEEARAVAYEIAQLEWLVAYNVKAEFFKSIKDFDAAEQVYKDIAVKFNFNGKLVSFYKGVMKQKKHPFYQRAAEGYEATEKQYFPKGLKKVKIEDFKGEPKFGVSFAKENYNTTKFGIYKGAVIVAVDGYLVENIPQYYFVREFKITKPMNLIVWQNGQYEAIKTRTNNRRFGLSMRSFSR